MWRLFGASLWASWCSSEAGYVNDIVTIEAASNNFSPATVNPADCGVKINELKNLIEFVKETREAKHLSDHYGTVAVYPPDWQEFRSRYPTIFARAYPSFQPEDPATGPQTPCPLNEAVAAAIRAQIPMRASSAVPSMMIPPSSEVQSNDGSHHGSHAAAPGKRSKPHAAAPLWIPSARKCIQPTFQIVAVVVLSCS